MRHSFVLLRKNEQNVSKMLQLKSLETERNTAIGKNCRKWKIAGS
jgi:hypothetical protein